jgi:LEA14-like dessication related protein
MLAGLSSDKPQEIKIGTTTLTVESMRSHWGDVNEDFTEIITLATIRNDNPIPISITKFHYLVEMNGIKVAEGSSDVSTVVQPKSKTTLTLISKLDNKMLDEWWVSHIKNGEKTKVRIVLQPVVEIAGKEFKFTLVEKESEFTTDLLGVQR